MNRTYSLDETTQRRRAAALFRLLLLLLMIVAGAGHVWGQTYETGELGEGFYYIVHNDSKAFSLCPAEDPTDNTKGWWYESTTANGKPFLTTNKNVPDDYRLWHLTKSLSNATVILKGSTHVLGNVYGGGNKADVEGSTKVQIPAAD